MLTSEDHALLVDIQDRLIDLFVQQDEARRAEDWVRMHALQVKIDNLRRQDKRPRYHPRNNVSKNYVSFSKR
jgi:hypothetical protein